MKTTAPKAPRIKKEDALALFDGNVSALARWFECTRAAYYEWSEYLPGEKAYQLKEAFPDVKTE